jgi:chemotaxis-related protein WspB
MLFLLVQLGTDRYALETGPVVEVLPLVHVQPILQAPTGVAGVFNYHGTPVPLIDLAVLALGKPSCVRMSTRIIVIRHVEEAGDGQLLGLLAEQTTDTLRRADADFVNPGIAAATVPYLRSVTTDTRGIIQRVDLRNLLAVYERHQLFRQPSEAV